MDEMVVLMAIALASTVLAYLALAAALAYMGDWSLRRKKSQR